MTKRQRKKWVLGCVLLLAAFLIVRMTGFFSNRNLYKLYEYVLRDRVLLPIYLVLTSPEENIRTTQLPVYELEVKGRYLDELNADLPAHKIPPSCQEYKPAVFRHNGLRYRVQVRYRGDNLWHFIGPQKSWRVKFKKSDRFINHRLINLMNPKTQTAMISLMGYSLAKRMNLLTPEAHLAHLVINREYAGVTLFVSQIDEYFLVNNHLAEGNVYYGEAMGIWEDPKLWTRRLIMTDTKDQNGDEDIVRLVKIANLSDPGEFKQNIDTILDMDNWFSIYAHSQVCGDEHRDNEHNQKLYFNPTTGKFNYIIWDPLGYGRETKFYAYENFRLNQVLNQLDGKILRIPEFVEQKNYRLYEVINGVGSLSNQLADFDEKYQSARQDIYCDILKDYNFAAPLRFYTNEQYEQSIRKQREWIIRRDHYIREQLDYFDCELYKDINFQPQNMPNSPTGLTPLASYTISNGGECGIQLSEWRLRFNPSQQSRPREYYLYYDVNRNNIVDEKDILLDTTKIISSQPESICFRIHRSLLPARKKVNTGQVVECYLDYELERQRAFHTLLVACKTTEEASEDLFQNPSSNDIQAVNSVTRTPVPVRISQEYPADVVRGALPFDPQEQYRINETIVWGPGLHTLSKDVILPRTTQLIIQPDTMLQFSPGVSVLCYGPVMAVGQKDHPIIFQAANPKNPWGTFSMQGKGANESYFSYCEISSGSDDRLNGVFYSGMVSAYNCDITLEHCRIENAFGDDGVNYKFGHKGRVLHCTFIENHADALDLDFSNCLVEYCRFFNNKNDGVDMGTASAIIRNNDIIGCGDKGISIGEMSYPKIYNNTIMNNNVGIGSKDMSRPLVINNVIRGNRLGIACYQKKRMFGPSEIEVRNCIIVENEQTFAADLNSTLNIQFCQFPQDAVIAPLPKGIAEHPVAATQMVRSLDAPLINIANNVDLNQDKETVLRSGNMASIRKVIPDYSGSNVPIGLISP